MAATIERLFSNELSYPILIPDFKVQFLLAIAVKILFDTLFHHFSFQLIFRIPLQNYQVLLKYQLLVKLPSHWQEISHIFE
jgi:hypothetical protein